MQTIIRWLLSDIVMVSFHLDDGTIHIVSCEFDFLDDYLTKFNKLMDTLYKCLIHPIRKEMSRCRKRISIAERYIEKNYPMSADKREKYLEVIVVAKRRIDEMKKAEKSEMVKISSIYTVIPAEKIRYLRAIKNRKLIQDELQAIDRKIDAYEKYLLDDGRWIDGWFK